jgi:hypothetical protein
MKLFDEINISLEVIMLLVCGLATCILGVLLIPVGTGALPYYEAGTFGLLLILFGLQWQTTGITPFGFMKISWPVLIPGIAITGFGFVTCFVPGIFGDLSKYLVLAIFGIGGLVQILDLVYSKEKYPTWKKAGDRLINHRLPLSCAIIYLLEILIAGIIAMPLIMPGSIPIAIVAGVLLLFGISLFWLAMTLQKVYRIYPQADRSTNMPGISGGTVMGMEFGFFMLVAGCLLVPVNMGALPFAPGAQQGTMMVLLGVQALVAGSMMTFAFTRNGLVFLVGMLFVAVGSTAIIIQDMFLELLVIFIGIFNLAGGLYLAYTVMKGMTGKDILLLGSMAFGGVVLILYGLLTLIQGLIPGTLWIAIGFLSLIGGICLVSMVIKMLTALVSLQLSLVVVTVALMILFGLSMLIQGLIPGIMVGIILAVFGLSQFLMLYVNRLVEKRGQTA